MQTMLLGGQMVEKSKIVDLNEYRTRKKIKGIKEMLNTLDTMPPYMPFTIKDIEPEGMLMCRYTMGLPLAGYQLPLHRIFYITD